MLTRLYLAWLLFWGTEAARTEHALIVQGGSPLVAGSVAETITQWADQLGLDPAWVVGVIAVENRQLRPGAVSTAGAVGIMQVMPMHRNTYATVCGGTELRDPRINTCVGMHLLASYHTGTRTEAQTRYLGCAPARCPSYHRQVSRYTERAVEARESAPARGASP